MIDLDGSDGGGQLIRTALALSALGGEPFRMERVRGSRPNPGLKRQHLACVEAVAALTNADVAGDVVGSETLRFEPVADLGAAATPDDVAADIGTAGSVTLVADTLLPLATRIDRPLRAALAGGTDVRWSPSTDYLRRVKLPLLRAVGLDAGVGVERRGFYPAGGGDLDVRLRPSSIDPIELGRRPRDDSGGVLPDPDTNTRVAIHVAAATDPDGEEGVAERVADATVEELDGRGIDGDAAVSTASVDADSPGVVLTLVFGGTPAPGGAADTPSPRAGFVVYGDPSDQPGALAEPAADAAERWLETGAPVDAHLADQLVVWLALAGGAVPVPRVTDHLRTNVDLVSAFGYDVSIEAPADGAPTIVSPVRR